MVLSAAFPNGQTRNFSYDDQGRLTQLSNLDPASTNLATYAYGYDHDWAAGTDTMLGQRTSMAATVPSQGFAGDTTKGAYWGRSWHMALSSPFLNGQSRNFSCDDQGRLTQLSNLDPASSVLATYA